MTSDLDIVVLTIEQDRYLLEDSWVDAALPRSGRIVATREWGPLTERRVALPSGLEVEFGFTSPNWAAVDPLDLGTATVVRNGCRSLHDPNSLIATLVKAATVS